MTTTGTPDAPDTTTAAPEEVSSANKEVSSTEEISSEEEDMEVKSEEKGDPQAMEPTSLATATGDGISLSNHNQSTGADERGRDLQKVKRFAQELDDADKQAKRGSRRGSNSIIQVESPPSSAKNRRASFQEKFGGPPSARSAAMSTGTGTGRNDDEDHEDEDEDGSIEAVTKDSIPEIGQPGAFAESGGTPPPGVSPRRMDPSTEEDLLQATEVPAAADHDVEVGTEEEETRGIEVAEKVDLTKKGWGWLKYVFVVLVLAMGAATAVAVICGDGSCNADNSGGDELLGLPEEEVGAALPGLESSSPTGSTPSPSTSPTEFMQSLTEKVMRLRALLPDYTLHGRAFQWVLEHPEFEDLEDWRLQQMFAIVAYYYNMNGENWLATDKQNWLNYSVSECYWGNMDTEDWLKNLCHEDGTFHQLLLLGGEHSHAMSEGFDESIPPEIELLSNLNFLFIEMGQLNVPLEMVLPWTLQNMVNLTKLSYFQDILTGTVPDNTFDLLSRLDYLSWDWNMISGTLPTGVGTLTALEGFFARDNLFIGALPSEVGMLSHLTRFGVAGNRFTGKVPSELGLLQNLTQLYLHDNHFTGMLPTEICGLPQLTSLEVDCQTECITCPEDCGCFCYYLDH
ncbi:Leucine Rich Repeat [Seminavis robusta]|uniref:Leucine Rich Repeat n=1 Tax=Seminavis robusta TaxID=568900 RepID=A0A9N8DUM1_9STRA|nr:Leucine Rich Repeat [Seminavis robusta]|eukprot:Sro369_g128170.1 Leucine Rich Repeat (626) ;mRNA; r:26363-28317